MNVVPGVTDRSNLAAYNFLIEMVFCIAAAIWNLLVGLGLAFWQDVAFCNPIIFRKRRQSVPVSSEQFRNGSEKIGPVVI